MPTDPSLCVAFVQLVGGWVGFSFRASVHLSASHVTSLLSRILTLYKMLLSPLIFLPSPGITHSSRGLAPFVGDSLRNNVQSTRCDLGVAFKPSVGGAQRPGRVRTAEPVSAVATCIFTPADVSRRPSRVIQAPPPAPGSALGLGCPFSVRVCGRVTAVTWDPQEASPSPEPRACALCLCSCRRHHFQNAEGGASPCPFREEVSCIPLSQSAFFPGILQSTK